MHYMPYILHARLIQKPMSTSNPAGPPEIQGYTGVFQEIRCKHSKPTDVDPIVMLWFFSCVQRPYVWYDRGIKEALRKTWKLTEDIGLHGVDFAVDLTRASIFSGNPEIRL